MNQLNKYNKENLKDHLYQIIQTNNSLSISQLHKTNLLNKNIKRQ